MYVLSGTVARFSIDDSGTRYVRTSGFADGVMFPIMGHIMARGVGNIADDTMLAQCGLDLGLQQSKFPTHSPFVFVLVCSGSKLRIGGKVSVSTIALLLLDRIVVLHT